MIKNSVESAHREISVKGRYLGNGQNGLRPKVLRIGNQRYVNACLAFNDRDRPQIPD